MNVDEERELLARYRPWLRKVALGICRSDLSRVDDLMQEGWVAVWRATRSWDGRAPLDWWLKYKAHGTMLMKIRDWDAQKHTFFKITDVLEAECELSGVELAYHHGEIAAALDRLSPREREYVILRFWGGFNYGELSDYFGYPPQGLWLRGRRKLTEELAYLR